MKRQNPLGTLFGIAFTILLFAGLGFSLYVNRGLAFNPGPLTAWEGDGRLIQGYRSHAEFEKQCSYCHEPFKSNLATKCIECHNDISNQIEIGQGIHSRISKVNECASCHAEHQGRSFNPIMASYRYFDHSKATFSLNWHQQNYDTKPMTCIACHKDGSFDRVNLEACTGCHQEHEGNFSEVHLQDYGVNCLSCHDGFDRMKSFDHTATSFPLEAKHVQAKCTDCHAGATISSTPTDCIACHQEPKIHKGTFDNTCNNCHSFEGWTPAVLDSKNFSHRENAKFSLGLHQSDYQQKDITCTTCHQSDNYQFDIQICIDCHAKNDNPTIANHLEQYGSDCLTCHDGVDRLSNFDHNRIFPLEGMHEQIQCIDCHANKVFRGTPAECLKCHQEPEIHAGVFGLKCNDCHTAIAWSPAQLANHAFPLSHGLNDTGASITCATCHETNFIEYTCYNCHEHDPRDVSQKHLEEGISEQELQACVKCHVNGDEVGG